MMNSLLGGGTFVPIRKNITTTSATDVAGSAEAGLTFVDWMQVVEIAGATPTVSVYSYDVNASTTVYLVKSHVMDPFEILHFERVPLAINQFLRIVSSAANQIDVFGLQLLSGKR